MDFGHSPKAREHIDRVGGFMTPHVLPREPESLAAPRDQEDRRAVSRTASGEPLGNPGGDRERIARSGIAIDRARLQVLHAARLPDTAVGELSRGKAGVPVTACEVIGTAIRPHGGAGPSDDLPRASAMADGPDEVHLGVVSRAELGRYRTREAA
ncbi:acyl-CoA dehydrogenase family protein [Streptomyces sp. bgisy095]|uniref:acyl-CoA dehydrogenase family protein n=1 Tax=unclassified Streptomyces TaxID=2593676 RepID=UPI003D738F38